MTLRLVLLALAISLSPLLLSAAVQHRPPTRQAAETELRLPRKKSFFPNQHARRYHYRLLKSDTGAAALFVLITTLSGLLLYGLLLLAYTKASGIYGWPWGILLNAIGGVVIGVIIVMIIRWLLFWFSGLRFRLRVPAFRRRYRRCPVR